MILTEKSDRNNQHSQRSVLVCGFNSTLKVIQRYAYPLNALVFCIATTILGLSLPSIARTPINNPTYTSSGQLIRPTNYREWVYVTSGLGMTYGASQSKAEQLQLFDNVFVTREAYEEFLRSGKWIDQTMFVLEIRQAKLNISINEGGHTQGKIAALEASVKDQSRFPDDGWAYFTFDSPQGLVDTAEPLPTSESCYSCHRTHAAFDNTFLQFYPTLLDIAHQLGTVNSTYDSTPKAQSLRLNDHVKWVMR